MNVENHYFGFLVRQRIDRDTVQFFTFYAPVKGVTDWVRVVRSIDSPQGTQRTLRDGRVQAIQRFVEASRINTIPNNLLIAFTEGSTTFEPMQMQEDMNNGCGDQLQWGILTFSYDSNSNVDKPALVVDGQHRLYGMSQYELENLPVLITALVDAPLEEQAFQFIVINDKATRVPVDNAKAIIANIDEEPLRKRLLASGVSYGKTTPLLSEVNDLDYSPFKDLLDWDYNKNTEKRVVKIAAIEQSFKQFENEFKIFYGDDYDSLLDLYLAVWTVLSSNFSDLWGKMTFTQMEEGEEIVKNSVFMTKVNLLAINEFFVEKIKQAWSFGILNDVYDTDEVKKQILRVAEAIPSDFWLSKWNIQIKDNLNTRNLIKESLQQIHDNHRLREPWYRKLKIIDVKGLPD